MPGYGVIPSIRTRNVKEALAFYTGTLGFQLLRGGPEEDNNSLKFGDAQIMIEGDGAFYSDDYNDAIRKRVGAQSANAFYIETDDVEGLFATVNGKQAPIIDPLSARDWGQSEFTVEDPDGNWLTFWQAT